MKVLMMEECIFAIDGAVKVENIMSVFDNSEFEKYKSEAKEVTICDKRKSAYLKVKFETELFGLWSPAKKRAPFVCIEPWYGRCDHNDFDGELSKKDYIINLNLTKSSVRLMK